MDTNLKLRRALLLVFGCLPMVAVHAELSFGVLLFAVPAVLSGGNLMNIVFVGWWFLGTYALTVLIYCCATYRCDSEGLNAWQRIGLVAGIVFAVPLILLGFAQRIGVLGPLFGAAAATIVLLTDRSQTTPTSEESNGRT